MQRVQCELLASLELPGRQGEQLVAPNEEEKVPAGQGRHRRPLSKEAVPGPQYFVGLAVGETVGCVVG